MLNLNQVWSSVNCTSNDSDFQNICLKIFKETRGTLSHVRDVICNIQNEDELARSCYLMEEILRSYRHAFIITIVSSFLNFGVIVGIVKQTYINFGSKAIYWSCFILTAAAPTLLYASIVIFTITTETKLPGLFDAPYVQPSPSGNVYGIGFYVTCVLVMLNIVLIFLLLRWLPYESNYNRFVKQKAKKTKKKKRKESMYDSYVLGYMPAVFQPDVYVTEYLTTDE